MDGTLINSSSGWNSHSGSLGSSSSFGNWVGDFVGTEAHNIGLRLNRDGLYYYGWVKIIIEDDGKLEIISYAYKLTANKPIIAGVHS